VSTFAHDNYDNTMVEFPGNDIELTFDDDNFISWPTINQHFIPTVNQLRMGIVKYLQNNNPEVLESEVKRVIREAEHYILWTHL
jgi:hypothetical protein